MMCALYLCICITNVYYFALVEIFCSVHVIALYVVVVSVFIITMQLLYIFWPYLLLAPPEIGEKNPANNGVMHDMK